MQHRSHEDGGSRCLSPAKLKPLSRACLAALGLASVTVAQAQVEEVIVTGTRIQTSGMQTPTPVTAVTTDELSAAVPQTMIEAISQLPQFNGNQTQNSPGSWFTRSGYGNLNLRGLGVNRTLTLLNGRRMMSSNAFGGVDINVFPEAVVNRVEVTTGGASAAYGTDAVAGVANFYLDTAFEGLDLSLNTGATAEGDGDSTEFKIAFGTEIGRNGHLIVSGEKFDQDGIQGYEGRDWYQAWGIIPDANGVNQILPNVITTSSTYDGLIFAPGFSLHQYEFDSQGNVSPFQVGSTAFGTVGTPPARHSVTNGGSGDNIAAERALLMPENERESLFLYYDHQVGDNVTFYAQAIRSNVDNFQLPDGATASMKGTPTAVTIFQDNAFLPDPVRQAMISEGVGSFTFRRMGTLDDIIGPMYFATEQELDSLTAGFTIDIQGDGRFNGWTIDTYFQSGESDRKAYQHGFRVDRIHAAVDAVDDGNGNIVCRTSLSSSDYFDGCQPLNLFGRGNASPGAIDWVAGNDVGELISTPLHFPLSGGFDLGITDTYAAHDAKINRAVFEQDLFELTATGDIAEGWAGPIALAAGVAYRDESIYQTVRDSTNRSSDHVNGHPVLCNNDPEAVAALLRGVSAPDCANTVGIQYSKVSNITGKSDVSEVFVETYIPVVADQPAMQNMTLSFATRWADYSGSGQVNAWKAGVDMQFVDAFRVRFTQSQDVRAANMSERFDVTGGINPIDDSRYGETYNITRFSGGNPAVRPEEADTTTIGFVLTPNSAPNFSLSLDWYEIEISDAIGQLGVQSVADRCEESIVAGSPSELCNLVTRDVITDRLILVGDQFINIDEAVVSGTDLEVTWRKEIGSGGQAISTRIFASWLDENSEILQGVRKIDRAGQTGVQVSNGVAYALPDFRLTGNVTYTSGPFSVFVQGRYIGSGTQENAANLPGGPQISDNSVDSVFYTDVNFSWTKDLASGQTLQLFGNIRNLTDEDPPITAWWSNFGANAVQTNGLLFDLLGRQYTAGLRLRF
jgi:outer membrane receptor protein involved in Fe transport